MGQVIGSKSSAGYCFGQFTLNLDRASLQAHGADVDLRPKSFDVLRYLVERAGRIASKDEIVAAVWPDVIVSDDSLAQCIRDIRKVLKDEDEQFVKTVPRRGYMFVAEVAPRGAPKRNIESEAATETRTRGLDGAKAAVAGGMFAIALAALGAWNAGWFAAKPPAADAQLTIAVLPFASASEGSAEEWLGDGIAEDIMTAVSRFRDLALIARNSSFRFRGETDAREVGRQLNADFLLEGSIRRAGDQLRVTAQLVDARTGASRWTERYDGPFSNVFAVQDEIAEQVAALLVAHAREATVVRVRTLAPERLEAYELVLRARRAYLSFTRESTIEGRATPPLGRFLAVC
jgi:TolB-like protein/DNA-binding winged helix-turn-helix (wHTH) protein